MPSATSRTDAASATLMPVHVDQDQGQPLALGQPVQRLPDVEPHLDAGVVVVAVGQHRQVGVGQLHGGLDPAQPVQAGVDHDPVQPGGHRGLAAEGVRATVRREERLLHGVGRQLGVTGGAQRDGPHPVTVSAEQLTEGVGVTGAVSRQQVAVRELGEFLQA